MSEPLEVLASLEGLVSEEVGRRLLRLAALVPVTEAIVEIGSYKGKSTSYLATGSKGSPVFAVDPWDSAGNATGRFGFAKPETREAFERQLRLAGVRDRVTAVRGFSSEVSFEYRGPPIGLLYIDGSHTEQDVWADWLGWSRHLAPRAVVAFDDWNTERNPGVARVVSRLRTIGGRWEFEPRPLAIWWRP